MSPDLPNPEDIGAAEQATGFLRAELASALEGAWMPSLPQVLLRVLALADDDSAGLGELAELISRDPGLCARLLTVANSAALRRGRELRRIDECVSVLGTRFVRTMAACLAVQAAFDDVARRLECDLSGFWLHSLEVAELARSLAQATGLAGAEEAYLAGLLHDTGELLLLTGVPGYAGLLMAAGDESLLCDLERRALGAHHGAVGAWLVEHWHIDSFLADAILFHHESGERIAAADALTRLLWAAHAAAVAADALPEAAAAAIALDADGFASLRAEARQRTASVAAALGIDAEAAAGTLPRPTVAAAVAAVSPLAEAAHGLAFAQPLQESLFAAGSDEELLLTARESARILFGLGRMGLLIADHERGQLSGGRIGGQPALLRRLEIPLANSSALPARAAQEGRAVSSFDGAVDASLADLQILRALGGDGLLCVPLIARRRCCGVMVFGVSTAQWPRIVRRLSWLTNFARIVAAGIEALRESRAREQAAEAAVASQYRLRARQVAHEAGNPLAIIRNYLKLLERKLAGQEAVARELAFLDDEIARVTAILQDIGEAGGEGDGEAEMPSQCDVVQLIRDLMAGYREPLFAARGIEVSLDLPAAGAVAAVRREPVTQVLLNLWKNAAEAMAAGGAYRIEVVAGAWDGHRHLVEIRLHDDGPGLPAATLARLADGEAPELSSGVRGLGLGIVRELVAAMSGRIVCASQPGRGTLFSIHLPSCED